jgi:hypothetical protein
MQRPKQEWYFVSTFAFLLLSSPVPNFIFRLRVSSSKIRVGMNPFLSLKCEIKNLPRASEACNFTTAFGCMHSIFKRAFNVSSAAISEQQL